MLLKIPRLYDSHVHWLATGQGVMGLPLQNLQRAEDVAALKPRPGDFRGEWLIGFGWDQTSWPQAPTKEILDRCFPKTPVFFSRCDAHCSWLNSEALHRLGYPDSHSGLLYEQEHFQAYHRLPELSDSELRRALLSATALFHRQGFTHIRDMTCSQAQWRQARWLDLEGELNLYVLINFLCAHPKELTTTLALAQKAHSEETPHLRVQGLKIFYDGTLGSKTAFLSQPCGCGVKTSAWKEESFKEFVTRAWQASLEISIHTIGDQAAHDIVQWTRQVMATNKVTGKINLEHVEVLRPETIQMMKALHIRCHMQPCHWLSDRVWLADRLGPLLKYAFPWASLAKAGVPLSFGSDAPIAAPSFQGNLRALNESAAAGIAPLNQDPTLFHIFPEEWGMETFSVFSDLKLQEIHVDGKRLGIGS